MHECLLLAYHIPLSDPPMRQAAASLVEIGYRVTLLTLTLPNDHATTVPSGVHLIQAKKPRLSPKLGPFYRLFLWLTFQRELAAQLCTLKPSLILTIMLHPLAALPADAINYGNNVVSCIYDIPSPADSGRLDRWICRRAWRRLRAASVVWASDVYKAQLAQTLGHLPDLPLITHNCPPRAYLPEPVWPRDTWLRQELRQQGATIGMRDGCILLRAGAVGECGGLEETLAAMRQLPQDTVFLMIGRPPNDYQTHLRKLIAQLGLTRRAFVWDRPSDEVWIKCLQGADIGHLIHGPFPPGRLTRLYELNSSLSNNRLFQYMAAGLPIITYDDPRLDALYREVDCFRVTRLKQIKADLVSIIKDLGQSLQTRVDLGTAGRQAHLRTYHWEHQFAPVLSRIRAPHARGPQCP